MIIIFSTANATARRTTECRKHNIFVCSLRLQPFALTQIKWVNEFMVVIALQTKLLIVNGVCVCWNCYVVVIAFCGSNM